MAAMLSVVSMLAVADEPAVRPIEINFTHLAYVDIGRGVPIVFVHGALEDWRIMEPIRPMISREFRYVAYSRRYHYPTIWDDKGENYTVSQHVEDLVELIRELKLGKVHLFGSSYGGRVAGMLALRHPELVRSLILSDSFLIPPTSPSGLAARDAYNRDMDRVAQLVREKKIVESLSAMYDTVNGPAFSVADVSRELFRQFRDNEETMPAMFASAFPPSPGCDELSRIKVPVLVLGGEKTRSFFAEGNARLKSCLPPSSSESARVPGAPHQWYTINPVAGGEIILRFIRRH